MIRVHCIVQVSFASISFLDVWARENNYAFAATLSHGKQALPKVEDFDLLIILGGPQNAEATDKYPYLTKVMQLINNAIAANKKVLGICLGAQLIAAALGAPSEKSPEKEMGIFPVTLNAAGMLDPVVRHLPSTFNSAHWHYDMPGLPDNSTVLASSAGCPRQIVRFNANSYGLQCHLEFTKPLMEKIIAKYQETMVQSQYTQSKTTMLAYDYPAINDTLQLFLRHFIAQ